MSHVKPTSNHTSSIAEEAPRHEQSEDEFERYPFAKRVSEFIAMRNGEGCLAIGIHGKWGEGKTTVLNFVDSELSNVNHVEVVRFNPWRYTNSDDLLTEFYNAIAESLDSRIKPLSKLIRKAQGIAAAAAPIGDMVQPGAGTAASGGLAIAWSLIPKSGVEKLKKEADEILRKAGKTVAVIVDDIDRLDTEEIAELFGLLKVNADLNRIVYVLAFEKEFVARALEKKYSGSGHDFLEKLIQLPFDLPAIRHAVLYSFWANGITEVLKEFELLNNISESELESVRGSLIFVGAKIETPRNAIRHWNSLRFALLGLKNEVDLGDLIVIEWVRIAAPAVHQFVQKNRDCFLGLSGGSHERNPKEEAFEETLRTLDRDSIELAKEIRGKIFPSAIDGYAISDWEKNWFLGKRICSETFFDRYFHYGLHSDDVPEHDLRTILRGELSVAKWRQVFEGHAERNAACILEHLVRRKDEISKESARRIPFFFLHRADLFPEYGSELSLPATVAATLIGDCFEAIAASADELSQYLKSLIAQASPSALWILTQSFRYVLHKNWGGWSFPASVKSEIVPLLVERLKEAAPEGIGDWFWGFAAFYRDLDESDWDAWFSRFIRQKSSRGLQVLKAIAPKRLPSGLPSNLNGDFYRSAAAMLNIDALAEAFVQDSPPGVGDNLPDEFPEKRGSATPDDAELVTQFFWLHRHFSLSNRADGEDKENQGV